MSVQIYLGDVPANVRQWVIDNWQSNDKLRLVVQTTSDYKKSGIYSAERDDTSKPVIIDWGDGTVEQVNDNVSQKVHEYATVGTFNVVVENIKSYAASTNNYTWYKTISQNRYTLKDVAVIPNSVTNIGQYAFQYCTSLTSVTIGNSVTNIGQYAFQYCTSLTSVTIPNSVMSIGEGAFYATNNMQTITFENRTKSQVQAMQYYSWSATTMPYGTIPGSYYPTITFVCSDGNIVLDKSVESGGSN